MILPAVKPLSYLRVNKWGKLYVNGFRFNINWFNLNEAVSQAQLFKLKQTKNNFHLWFTQVYTNIHPSVEPAMCCRGICPNSMCGSVSSWPPISNNNSRLRLKVACLVLRFQRHSKRMIEINLCVVLGLSRGNLSWLNCAMTSISARGNSSCYLVWLHNRESAHTGLFTLTNAQHTQAEKTKAQ